LGEGSRLTLKSKSYPGHHACENRHPDTGLQKKDLAVEVSPCLQPVEDAGLPPPLCVAVVQCPAGTCYKSGKVGWLLNLYWWKKKRLIVYRIHIRSSKPPDPDYQELRVLECSRFVVPS